MKKKNWAAFGKGIFFSWDDDFKKLIMSGMRIEY